MTGFGVLGGTLELELVGSGAASGAHEWNRTIDLLLTKEVLYRLSYVSVICWNLARKLQQGNGAGDGNRTRTISLEG